MRRSNANRKESEQIIKATQQTNDESSTTSREQNGNGKSSRIFRGHTNFPDNIDQTRVDIADDLQEFANTNSIQENMNSSISHDINSQSNCYQYSPERDQMAERTTPAATDEAMDSNQPPPYRSRCNTWPRLHQNHGNDNQLTSLPGDVIKTEPLDGT